MKLIPVAAIAIAAGLFFAPAGAQQATPETHEHATPPSQAGGTMDHGKMMAGMKEADARLEALVQAMKSASANDKMGVMQELLTALVANQVEAHRHMSMMHDHMMSKMGHQ